LTGQGAGLPRIADFAPFLRFYARHRDDARGLMMRAGDAALLGRLTVATGGCDSACTIHGHAPCALVSHDSSGRGRQGILGRARLLLLGVLEYALEYLE
jgi:hypothetical protein